MPNLNKIIKQVLLEQFDRSEMGKFTSELKRYTNKMNDVTIGESVDEILGIQGFVERDFMPKLMNDIKNGEYGYNVDDVLKNLDFLNKVNFTLNTIKGEKIPIKVKNKMYKDVLNNEFCVKCRTNGEVRDAVSEYIKQKIPTYKPHPKPTPKVKSKEYTPSKKDMDRLERLAKTSSKANDIWRKYGIGSSSLRMGDYNVTIELNKDITIGDQDLKKGKNYETTFDKDSKSLIYRVKKADIYFNIDNNPRKDENYRVTDIDVIIRQGPNLKKSVPPPSSLVLKVVQIEKN